MATRVIVSALHILSFLTCHAYAQSSPPLQWLNITNLLQGNDKPMALTDAVIGYDSGSSTVIIFGGESSDGIVQSTTYLLDTQTLIWSAPSPPPNLLTVPTARSAAVSGDDFAASYRHGFVVIGGKGPNEEPLSDVWEFDFISQFWANVNIVGNAPSSRWNAAGGRDPRSESITDPVIASPNNSFFLAGGFDGSSLETLSDVWRLNITGVLSSNNPTSVNGSWQQVPINNANHPSMQNSSGTMVMDSVAIYGGCNTSLASNDSCATQTSYVLETDTQNSISPSLCPAPRFSGAMTQNLNTFSTTSNTQAMLVLGTFNGSLWSDGNSLEDGEVALLDVNAGTWTRVIPSGDPGNSGTPSVPSPRSGSAIVSSATPIFGNTSGNYSETLIFGGRDSSGNYLSELWVLRAYNGEATKSNPHWSGYGDGVLQTGVNASGTGVTVTFVSNCASSLSTGSSSTSGGDSGSPTDKPSPSGSSPSTTSFYNTSVTHKIFAPLSLALVGCAIIFGRAFLPFFNDKVFSVASFTFCISIAAACVGLGIAGLVTAFTSISFTATLNKRSSSAGLHLQTNHGKAALAFFVGLYVVVPFLWILSWRVSHPSIPNNTTEESEMIDKQQTISVDTTEKFRTAHSRSRTPSMLSSPRQRTHSWSPSILWRPSVDRRMSSDSESNGSAGPQSALSPPSEPPRSFEVVNRPSRIHRNQTANMDRNPTGSLRDIDWLQRRRSLNIFGELDYALTQAQRSREREQLSTPATTDRLTGPTPHTFRSPQMPSTIGIIIHILLQSFLIGLSVITLIMLWSHSLPGFIIFLLWTIAFYLIIIFLAWNGKPVISILAVLLTRLRTPQSPKETNRYLASQTPPLSAPDHYIFPTHSPYLNEPPFHAAASTDLSHGARSVVTDNDDDDEDEDARQRRIESEMERREVVTLTTIPRRKLFLSNPDKNA